MDNLIFDAARQGHTILTVNDRLARHLLRQYDLAQQGSGLSAWLRPEIQSLTAWLARQVQRLSQRPDFLSKVQCLRVWEMIIEADLEQTGNYLLQVKPTAQRAYQAHQLLVQYAADFRASEGAEDHRAFLRWRSVWRQQLVQHGWQDSAERPWLIAAAIIAGRVPVPTHVIMAGFDDMTPDVRQLCQVMTDHGTVVTAWHPAPFQQAQRQRVAAHDPADEVRRCARWINHILETNPAAAIGVVAPQMEIYQPLVENIFPTELDPSAVLDGDEVPTVFNLSLGHRLDREGPVCAALRLLRVGKVLSLDEVGWLLRSPYVGPAAAERDARAQTDRELRRCGLAEWSSYRLVKTIDTLGKKFHPDGLQFAKIIATLQDALQNNAKRMPSEWAESFLQLLRQLGWPGDRVLSSREYQAIQHFNGVLGELASLDRVTAPLNRVEALKVFARLVSSADFQPEGSDCTIQVLGELEASGMTFDYLWVLGLHDAALPQPPSPNPFIPLPVQRQYKMKRVDAERERHFAAQIAERLFLAAPEIVLSWPRQVNGSEHRPSPFITDISEGEPLLAESQSPSMQMWLSRPLLKTLDDCRVNPLISKKSFTGGTGIIKDQALCPFRAFAHHRLRAVGLDAPEIGVDNMARGTLAHTVLEIFWNMTIDQSTLLALDEQSLMQRLEQAAEQALCRFEKEQRCDLPTRQRRIESQRLVRLARQWLELEKKRPPFRVKASEINHQVAVGKLTIRTRIDRIDSLDHDQDAIIDYKTGRPDPSQWLEQRITEPQLPLYCLGRSKDQVGAVMFATVRTKEKECGFRGLARDASGWPGAGQRTLGALMEEKGLASFDDVLSHWDQALPLLGNAFADGEAAVDPVDPERTCQYCDLTSFCRILDVEEIMTLKEGEHA